MAHPSLEELLTPGSDVRAHLDACAVCRRLAALAQQSPAAPAAPDDLPVIDRDVYTGVEELKDGRGGMGRAFRAHDRRLGRVVAIKEPVLPDAGDPHALQDLYRRFEREARLTARLEHPAIVAVHEAGRWPDGRPFYAMRLLAGSPLDEEIARRPTLVERLALLPNLVTVVHAIAYAHEQRIVHRDVKPQNIILGPFGETVVIDWGLAKDLAEAAREGAPREGRTSGAFDLTQLGVGTPGYMPPEQARGAEPDPGMDVYAIGATLYHTLAAAPPYGARDAASARRALLAGPPPALESVRPDVPPELSAITAKAMARRPEERFASAKELAGELERYLAGLRLRTYLYSTAELLRLFVRRHRAAVRMAAVALVLLGVVVTLAVARVVRERNRAEQGERAARRELSTARGVTASRLAADPTTRLDALALGVSAVGGALRDGEPPSFEARQGLFDAVTAGPAALLLSENHGSAYGMDVSLDERLIATSSDDGTVRVFDAANGRLLASRRSPLSQSSHVRFDPPASRLVAWGSNDVALLWRVGAGTDTLLRTGGVVAGAGFLGDQVVAAGTAAVAWDTEGHEIQRTALPAQATAMAVSAHAGRVAVGMLGGGVVLWDPRDGSLRALTPHAGDVKAMDFARDGRTLVTSGRDGRMLAHDVEGGLARTVASVTDLLFGNMLSVAPDGRHAAAGASITPTEEVRTILADLAGTTPVRLEGMGWATQPFVSGGARILLGRPGSVSLRDVATLDEVARFETGIQAPELELRLLDREPGAARIVIAGGTKAPPRIIDARTGIAGGLLLGPTKEIMAAVVAPGGARLLTTSLDGVARIWDTATGAEVSALHADAELVEGAWLDGARAVVAGMDGSVLVVDAATGRLLARGGGGAPARALAVSPGGRRVAACSVDGSISVVEAATGRIERRIDRTGLSCQAAAFSPDGRRLAAGYADGRARAWDADSGAALGSLGGEKPALGVTAVRYTPDGAALVVGFGDGTSAIADAATLTVKRTLEGRVLSAPSSPFSPDGARVVAVTADGRVLLHPLAGGEPRTLDGHRELVLAAAFSTDGSRLVTADVGGGVRLWDLSGEGGRPLATHTGALGEATAVALTPDGRHVFVGYGSGALRAYPTTVDSALASACATLHSFAIDDAAGYCASTRTSRNAAHDR